MNSSLSSSVGPGVDGGDDRWLEGAMDDDRNTSTEFSESAYLQTHLGARYRGLAESVALSVVYCSILVTGVVGNLATCVVIAWNAHMHTATNYYLFSLAISDTITLVLGMMADNDDPVSNRKIAVKLA